MSRQGNGDEAERRPIKEANLFTISGQNTLLKHLRGKHLEHPLALFKSNIGNYKT